MILVDANVLLYAHDASSEHHDAVRVWLERTISADEGIVFAWMTLLAFLRIATDVRIYDVPKSPSEAVAIISSLLEQPSVAIVSPSEDHWAILSSLLPAQQARGALVMDAHLAALAREHGMSICTTDRDFARFPDLRIVDPLSG